MPRARNEMSRTVSRSGYSFDPATAFESNDLGALRLKDRRTVVNEMEQLVRRPAPAHRHRPGVPEKSADPDL